MHRNRVSALLAVAAIVVGACGGPATSSGPSGAAPTDAPPASPSETAEQTLTYVIDSTLSGGMSNAADNVPTAEAIGFMYNALYEYNEAIEVRPALARDLAEVSDDGTVWTIELRDDVTFHDGTPLTADDVVLAFEMARSPNCRFSPASCIGGFLEGVEKVDDHTVRFTLSDRLATFATVYLPAIFIENGTRIRESYGRYTEGRDQVSQAELQALVDRVVEEEEAPTGPDGTVDYARFLGELEAILTRAEAELPDKEAYAGEDGTLDENAYGLELTTRAKTLLTTFTAGEYDAIAAAYPYLDWQFEPVGMGTGPFEFVSYRAGESIEMQAFEDYFLGAPRISKLFFPIITDDLAGGQALAAGQVDWKYSLEGGTYEQIKDDPNLQFVEYPEFGYYGVYFNMRDGRLFADRNLRQAVAYCFDKEATVEAATQGQGVPIWSEIPPASWAFPTSGVEQYAFDPAKGKALVEQSGWAMGSDGIYEKDGAKLSTVAGVRAGRPDRSRFMQLLGDQVRDNCGIDISYKEVDFAALLNMLTIYPHINAAAPESGQPFDAYFGGFVGGVDPDPYSTYHSAECSTAERPDTNNYICYANPEVDRLIEEGLRTYDQAERTRIYAEYAAIQAQDLPVLYAWSDIHHEGLRRTVGLEGREMPLDTPYFFARTELLVNPTSR